MRFLPLPFFEAELFTERGRVFACGALDELDPAGMVELGCEAFFSLFPDATWALPLFFFSGFICLEIDVEGNDFKQSSTVCMSSDGFGTSPNSSVELLGGK